MAAVQIACSSEVNMTPCPSKIVECCIENRGLVESVEETQDWVVVSHTEGLLCCVYNHLILVCELLNHCAQFHSPLY